MELYFYCIIPFVSDAFQRIFHFNKILMNARLVHITVMLMRTARTPKDHSIVRVIRDTLELESRVLVSSFIEGFPLTYQNEYS